MRTYDFIIEMLAMAASLTESFLPMERAASERCENDVFRASSRLTTMLMNCAGASGQNGWLVTSYECE